MIAPPASTDTTEDAFLGGRLFVLQPRKGYRAGVDAVLLAAAAPVEPDGATVLDCGSGAGTVGLCVAARLGSSQVSLVERAPELCEIAAHNIARNRLGDRVRLAPGDVTSAASDRSAPDLPLQSFDHVLANPPFHDASRGTPAANGLKAASHAMEEGALGQWVRFAARMAKPAGTLTLIHKAEALDTLLAALATRFGAATILPIHARADEPAIRVLIQARKGSRAPLTLRPPLILHSGAGHEFTPHVAAILREGQPLRLA